MDGSARGAGVGEALNRAAVDEAHRRGARTVDLTSALAGGRQPPVPADGLRGPDSTVYRWSGDDQEA